MKTRRTRHLQMVLIVAGSVLLTILARVAAAYEVYSHAEAALHLTGNPVNYLDQVEDNSPVGALARVSEDGTGYGSAYSIDASALTNFGYNRAKADLTATDLDLVQAWGRAVSRYEDEFTQPGPAGR